MLKRDWLLQLDDGLEKRWAAVQALCQKVPAPEYYAALMRKTGFALTLEEVRIPAEEFLLAARMARTIRERITVLDISAQAGVLEKAAAKTLELLKKDAA
jgi:glycerol dehydrogenase-like iron-containing ADH family enzyme